MPSVFPGAIDSFVDPLSTSPLSSPSHALQHQNINDAVEKVEAKLGTGTPPATAIGLYTSYTPTWINLTVGNATQNFKYTRINNFVHFWGTLIFGSTTVMGTNPSISLPVTQQTGYSFSPPGTVIFGDSGVATYQAFPIGLNSVNVNFFVQNFATAYGSEVSVSATVPFTWGTNDHININFYYAAA